MSHESNTPPPHEEIQTLFQQMKNLSNRIQHHLQICITLSKSQEENHEEEIRKHHNKYLELHRQQQKLFSRIKELKGHK